MFRKKWRNVVLVEGQKEAEIVARYFEIPGSNNTKFSEFPVDVSSDTLRTYRQAMKLSIIFSKQNIYNYFYKEGHVLNHADVKITLHE